MGFTVSPTKSEKGNFKEQGLQQQNEPKPPKKTEEIVEIGSENEYSDKRQFDQSLWLILEPLLTKYHKEQVKKIKKSFDFIVAYDREMFNDKDEFFISILKKEVVKSISLKKEASKISTEMVEEIERNIAKLIKKK